MGDGAKLLNASDTAWSLQGELDYASVPALYRQAGMQPPERDQIKVDLQGITRADSAGLALLVDWLRNAELAGKKISFVNAPAQLLSIARVCGVDKILSLSN